MTDKDKITIVSFRETHLSNWIYFLFNANGLFLIYFRNMLAW